MKVEIITIGDELLAGQTSDSNAVFLGQKLTEIGLRPQWLTTVGDNPGEIGEALRQALKRAGLIIITGGLGPTEDDVTRRAVAHALGRQLVLEERILEDIRERLERRGRKLLTGQQSLALIPQGARVFANPRGLAPGLLLKIDDKLIFLLPGVPREMQAIFEEMVRPVLGQLAPQKAVPQRRLRTAGITESALQERLRGISPEGIKLSFLPGAWSVDLWLTGRSTNFQEAEALIFRASRQIEGRLGDLIYGVDDDTMERVVAALLIMKGITIAVAESCTGGLLTDRLTDVPGSSAYFERSVVAYSNQAKRELLRVPKRTLERFGAVSQETAVAMAKGIRRISGTDLGLSTTGVAGPSGATAEKPVGLVFVGLAHGESSVAQRFLFGQDRRANKECCVLAALNIVRKYLLTL
jgi:nicotinamide-nucleotide amidase